MPSIDLPSLAGNGKIANVASLRCPRQDTVSYGITCVQFVRCVVLTVQKVEGNKRIELSLKASLVNSGLVARHLHLCSLIVGEVRGF